MRRKKGRFLNTLILVDDDERIMVPDEPLEEWMHGGVGK